MYYYILNFILMLYLYFQILFKFSNFKYYKMSTIYVLKIFEYIWIPDKYHICYFQDLMREIAILLFVAFVAIIL